MSPGITVPLREEPRAFLIHGAPVLKLGLFIVVIDREPEG